ncbi:hypothetical protein AB0G86_44145 [Streptomyces scabiei]|uniref:hypothetical protein n=1 Tax=Streptomyces scabiei TaxID=1930 RepID=UPI0033D939EA
MNADRAAASAQRKLWIVYASRFGPYGSETPFSAPRTRGLPLLLAPIASWSDSTVLLRVWLLLLAGGALWLGFRPRLSILHRPAAVWVAAGLYGSLWITVFYAGSAMPNHYTAMGATAAAGLLPRATSPVRRCRGGPGGCGEFVGGGLHVACLRSVGEGKCDLHDERDAALRSAVD